MKKLSFCFTDSDFKKLSDYLKESHFFNAILGFTLSFGEFSCEVRATSEYLYRLKDTFDYLNDINKEY